MRTRGRREGSKATNSPRGVRTNQPTFDIGVTFWIVCVTSIRCPANLAIRLSKQRGSLTQRTGDRRGAKSWPLACTVLFRKVMMRCKRVTCFAALGFKSTTSCGDQKMAATLGVGGILLGPRARWEVRGRGRCRGERVSWERF